MFLGCRYDVAHIINKHHLSIRNFYYLILCHIGIPFFICHKVGDEFIIRKTKRFSIPERAVQYLKTKRTAETPPIRL